MKYIITENRLNKVIEKYLNFAFKDLKEYYNIDFPDSRWWKNKTGATIMENDTITNILYVHGRYFNEMHSLFHLTEEEISMYILNWVKSFLNVNNISQIHRGNSFFFGWV